MATSSVTNKPPGTEAADNEERVNEYGGHDEVGGRGTQFGNLGTRPPSQTKAFA